MNRNRKPAAVALFAVACTGAFAITVSNIQQLEDAVWYASSGDKITLEEGVYDFGVGVHSNTPAHLYASVKITLKGESSDASKVVLRGFGARILYLGTVGNTIENITFENGDASGYSQSDSPYRNISAGGAILCQAKNSVAATVRNCVFRNNNGGARGGAAASWYSGTLSGGIGDFYNCVFSNNYASSTTANYGGGALNHAGIVSNCVFSGNHFDGETGDARTGGGAIFNAKSIIDCTFTNNYTVKRGGAVYCRDNTAAPTALISGCKFYDNRAGDEGAAVWIAGAWGENLTVSNCLFAENGPVSGKNMNGTVSTCSNVVACTFTGNTAYYGGAAYKCALKGCLFEGNKATKQQGGGAAYGSLLVACTNRANSGSGASELMVCRAEDCSFIDFGEPDVTVFRNASFSRCRFLHATNGWLFAGSIALTNCLISCSTNCLLFNAITAGSGFANCTVVSNSFAGMKSSSACAPMTVENTFFYGNSYVKNGSASWYDVGPDGDPTPVIGEFVNCILSGPSDDYIPGSANLNYYGLVGFRPGFVGEAADPENPFAIKRNSPAFAKAGVVRDWMAADTDIRGDGYPRLRDGKVNIGCYQCWLDPKGIEVNFR